MTHRKLIEQMLEALSHAQQENFRHRLEQQKIYNDVELANAITAAKEYLAAPEQSEPVGEIVADDMGRPFNAIQIRTHFYKEVPAIGTKLYTRPAPLRELSDEEIGQMGAL